MLIRESHGTSLNRETVDEDEESYQKMRNLHQTLYHFDYKIDHIFQQYLQEKLQAPDLDLQWFQEYRKVITLLAENYPEKFESYRQEVPSEEELLAKKFGSKP